MSNAPVILNFKTTVEAPTTTLSFGRSRNVTSGVVSLEVIAENTLQMADKDNENSKAALLKIILDQFFAGTLNPFFELESQPS